MISQKKATLIHGCHLEAEGWESVVWGSPSEGLWGSIPRGVQLSYDENVSLIFWGTGASEKDGVKESEYMFKLAISRLSELADLCGCSPEELKVFLEERSSLDRATQNTAEELRSYFDMCLLKGVTNPIIVAVATHASRSIKVGLALILKEEKYRIFRHRVIWAPADTFFDGAFVDDVVVIEPPHRGDISKWQTFRYAKTLFEIMGQGEDVFEKFLLEWGDLMKKYGIDVWWKPKK